MGGNIKLYKDLYASINVELLIRCQFLTFDSVVTQKVNLSMGNKTSVPIVHNKKI